MSTATDYDLIAIGSGPAGQRAAIQAAKLGRRVAVVERQRTVGGVCIDTGTIPSKTFREAVRRVYSRPGLEMPGGHVAERVRPTMRQLVGHVANVVTREIVTVRDVLARNDVEVLHGEASFVAPRAVAIDNEDGRRVATAANVLIAVGTVPSKPKGIEPDGEIILTSDSILDLAQLPRSMVVVGAGVIGVEYASMFAALGVQVTVIDQRQRALEFLDGEIVDELVHQLRNKDVIFRFGDGVERIQVVGSGPKHAHLQLASGKHLVADVVLFSGGRIGATAGLALDKAGLAADERGRLAVDADYRTAVPGIWAAGDVIGFPALAATSAEQGRLAASAIDRKSVV